MYLHGRSSHVAVLVEAKWSRVRWRAMMRERMHGDDGPAILVEAKRSLVRWRAAMCERMHGDHGPLCALMKAHVDDDDDPSRMYVGDGPWCALLKAHMP